MVLGTNGSVKVELVGTWSYLVSRGRYSLVLGGTRSLLGTIGWYLVVLGQLGAALVASEICFQKIYGLHGLYHQII